MSKKPTQQELLTEIRDLLIPVSNLSRFQIGKINDAIKAEEEKSKTEAKTSDDLNKEV